MKWLLVIGLLTAPAAADSWRETSKRFQGGGFLKYEVTGLHAVDDDPARMAAAAPDELVLTGVRMGAFVGAGAHVGYHLGVDLLAGSTIDKGGFAYDVALYPVGIASRFGHTGMVGIAMGIGASGAVGTLEDGAIVPVQTTLELGRGIRLLGRARVSYVLGAASRQSAAPNIPFADEFDAMLGIRLGRSYRHHGFPSGNGYFIAATYREQLGTRFVGVTLGYSLEAALPRRFLDDEERQRQERLERRRKRKRGR